MATTENESELHTGGFMPTVNDLVAGVAVIGAYVTRYGVLAEGQTPSLLLQFSTDLLIPLLGAVWLLAVPVCQVVQKVR